MKALIRSSSQDFKSVSVPDSIIERLQEAANRRGLSVTAWTVESLEQALQAEELGTSLGKTIEAYRILKVQLASGAIQIPRRSLTAIIQELFRKDKEATLSEWEEAGHWYGEYLKTLYGDEALKVLEAALKISWNLDEIEITDDGMRAELRLTSFYLSKEATELLMSYITGIFAAFDYEKRERKLLRGLANMRFEKVYHRQLGK
ncbi:MAG: hypothetical protein PVH79_00760 [Candidatus Bathyarchaeota archaeon]